MFISNHWFQSWSRAKSQYSRDSSNCFHSIQTHTHILYILVIVVDKPISIIFDFSLEIDFVLDVVLFACEWMRRTVTWSDGQLKLNKWSRFVQKCYDRKNEWRLRMKKRNQIESNRNERKKKCERRKIECWFVTPNDAKKWAMDFACATVNARFQFSSSQ